MRTHIKTPVDIWKCQTCSRTNWNWNKNVKLRLLSHFWNQRFVFIYYWMKSTSQNGTHTHQAYAFIILVHMCLHCGQSASLSLFFSHFCHFHPSDATNNRIMIITVALDSIHINAFLLSHSSNSQTVVRSDMVVFSKGTTWKKKQTMQINAIFLHMRTRVYTRCWWCWLRLKKGREIIIIFASFIHQYMYASKEWAYRIWQ